MNHVKKLYIIGAGGFGREVAWLVERINAVGMTWNLQGFIDDDISLHGTMQDDYPIVGGCDYLINSKSEVWVVCAVGSAATRMKIIEKLKTSEYVRFATLIDPMVQHSSRVAIGEGTIICAGTIITVDVTIGEHVIINLDCTIGHDVVVGDYVTIYPSANLSGNVKVGECAELGTGMQVIQGKSIGQGCILGAGTVVVKDIKERGIYIGVPAQKMG